MANNVVNTKVVLNHGSVDAFKTATDVLLLGEAGVAIDSKGVGKLVFGDGTNPVSKLPFSTLTPDEIKALVSTASGNVKIVAGDTAGTIKYSIDGGNSYSADVKVNGWDTVSNKANAAMPKAGGTFTGLITLSGAPTADLHAATKKYVDEKVASGAVQTVSIAAGTADGSVKLTVDGTAGSDVVVAGWSKLGTAAFTNSNAYATAAQGTKADAAMPKAGGTFTGDVTLKADPTEDLHAATKKYVDEKVKTVNDSSVRSAALGAGKTDGTMVLTVNGTAGTEVALPGFAAVKSTADAAKAQTDKLGTAAFTASSAYATAAQGKKADTALQSASIAAGTADGSVKLTVDGKAGSDVVVTGWSKLKSAAFAESSTFATAAQGTKADAAMPKAGGTFTGLITLSGAPTADLHAATKKYVDDQITNKIAASDAMVFRGTIGTNGTTTTLPTTGVVQGDTYKVISDITIPAAKAYGSDTNVSAKAGDLIVAMNATEWILVPSGDEEVTTISIASASSEVTVDKTAKTGSLVLGDAAAKMVETTFSATSANLPTSKAIADYIAGLKYITASANVASATKLQNARNVSITGGATAKAVSFNGTADVALNVTSINTDVLTNGTKVLVIDGGTITGATA